MASVMSSTIVNVAIPDMSQHFALGQDRAHWVSSGFMAAMTVSMLTTPWLLARFGYRQTYLICMWLLLLGGIGVAAFPITLAWCWWPAPAKGSPPGWYSPSRPSSSCARLRRTSRLRQRHLWHGRGAGTGDWS
jgi:MFS family permease